MNVSSVFDAIFEKFIDIIFLALHATNKKKKKWKRNSYYQKERIKYFFPNEYNQQSTIIRTFII